VRSWGPRPLVEGGAVVAAGPVRRRNNEVVLSCAGAVLARADHFGSWRAGGRARQFLGDPLGEGPTARAPTIEPVSDKTSARCSRIRPDRLTRKRGRLSVPVWGCLGTSRAVAVSRAGCSQNRGQIPRTRTREISHAEIWRRELRSEGGCPTHGHADDRAFSCVH